MSTGDPAVEWTPGAGWERLKRELPGMVPDLTAEDMRKADEIIGRAAERCPCCGKTGLTHPVLGVCMPCAANLGWDPHCEACTVEARGQNAAGLKHVPTCDSGKPAGSTPAPEEPAPHWMYCSYCYSARRFNSRHCRSDGTCCEPDQPVDPAVTCNADGVDLTLGGKVKSGGSTPVSEEPARPLDEEFALFADESLKLARETFDAQAETLQPPPLVERVLHEAVRAFVDAALGGCTPAQWQYWQVAASDFADVSLRAAVELAYARGISEGRRQATEGWEREWSVRYNDRYVLGLKFTEGGAKRRAEDEDGKAVSRLVGPWEPAEQPEGGTQ